MTPADLSALETIVRAVAREELLERFRHTRRREKADGSFHLYLHGRPSLWDCAAGSLIPEEAGGHADTLDGRPAPLNLVARTAVCAADRRLFEQWLDYLRAT